ncbi:NF-X1-type zinc finger protein NFXL2 [Morella rubra]|uniref:NF-X1-type zinc finger protein NFXL2 n=1 Tax=Morella rubra TaxID=262757 RepID=A0A6A1VYF6_9ROSI|nr:NF-X1-type zinc finger protein NFXL2 [Morella rubra]
MTSTNDHHKRPLSDSDSDSDSDIEYDKAGSELLRHADLSNSIFKAYFESTNQSSVSTADLSKIQSFLTSSSSGALSCLICLERIKRLDATWSCSSLCFAVFHLICIQSWGRQASDLSAARAATRLPVSPELASSWNCPKCRVQYTKSQIPKAYVCFCGKLRDPPSDPWVLPHSCGEICDRPLKHNCGHHCLLLCHPGPCPSCPKLVKSTCFCGAVNDVRRCGFKNFSCNNACSKLLDCGVHKCSETCHDGQCPPCRERGVYRCQCGRVELERECCERSFRCENPCGKVVACGKHVCGKGCHLAGECGNCPLEGKRTCPCGKRLYQGMPCDMDAPPLCGATCDKTLSCALHRCHERCHRGPCIETCRIVIAKSCRCGSLKKENRFLAIKICYVKGGVKECETVAAMLASAAAVTGIALHAQRKLRCKNHKCPSPCHRGACAPCPVVVTISCACGETHFEVPCGTEMDQKPPRCPKPCHIATLCRHVSTRKPHKCHYGACPPCQLPCEEEYPCGHKCKLRCHGPRPPPNPEFTLKPKKKKSIHQSEWTAGSTCPPCSELVWRSCVGRHIGAERMVVCSDKTQFSCENLCGNLLSCDNHYCTKTCHAVENLLATPVQIERSESCEECHLPCQKERKPTCSHPCPLSCHPGECSPCKVLVKRSCHCGALVHVFECIYYNGLSEEEQVTARSCGGPCHRKLPNCTHLCPEKCHPGQCPSPVRMCCKKVFVRCKCQTVKKEWLCQDVQAAYRSASCDPRDIPKNQYGLGLLSCNSDCKSKLEVVGSELLLRKSKVVEEKEPDPEKNVPKRRKRRDRVQEAKQISRLQKMTEAVKRLLLFVILVVALITVANYGYKGLIWLSDWMNEVEVQRQRRRYPPP